MAMNLPLLPGLRFSDPYKQNFHKNQVFHFKSSTCTGKKIINSSEKSTQNENIDPHTRAGLSTLTSAFTSDRLRNRETGLNESYPRILPQWIKYDKSVLKFNAYYLEHVVESAYENFRVRKCHIFYYLEDDSIHVTEAKEENSGIPQGYLIKRHRIEKSKGEYVTWRDLNLRSELMFYGKKFRICSCDDFTRKFYEDNGQPLNEPEPIPEIEIDDKFNKIDLRQNMENIGELKEYIEVKLGGGHPNKTLKQFLDNDRKVLNFDIAWWDEKYDKEEKRYKMNYYLADGTGLLNKKDEYYMPQDLILGNYINIYNRACLITDCDEFTKKWFKQNLGQDMVPIKVKRNPPQNVIHPIPPHNGFGSEEDSLLSVYFLQPKATMKDMEKMFKNDKHTLRFTAKLISSVPSDVERKFIVSFFVRDDTIQVFETADKNSGRQNSKFMERTKHKNPYTQKYYTEKDFAVGNNIYINKYIFKLQECDEYTKKYMKDNYEIFRDSDVSAVVERVRLAGLKYKSMDEYVIDILKTLDPSGVSFVSKEGIVEGLKK